MIGQNQLLDTINEYIINKTFPTFCIISGEEGSGKKTLCNHIANKLSSEIMFINNGVEDIRKFIDLASVQQRKILYVLEDGDSMSINAKNAILKIAEEPPTNSNIILLTTDKNYLTDTIRSRGPVFDILPYSKEELIAIYENWEQKYDINKVHLSLKIVDNPGLLKLALEKEIEETFNFSEKVLNNLDISLPNLLKISKSIKLTANDIGTIDLKLFILCFQYHLLNQMVDRIKDNNVLFKLSQILSTTKSQINFKSSNKKFVLDNFLINCWKITRGE